MIDGLREDSLYYKAYYLLRQPLIDLMFEGVRWDAASAEEERKAQLVKKDEIRAQILALTGGVRLWAEHRYRSGAVRDLLAEQRTVRGSIKGLPLRDERRKEAKSRIAQIQARLAELRATGGDVDIEAGVALSSPLVAKFLYGECKLPKQRRRRKGSGKTTVTVDDLALQELRLAFGDRPLAVGGGGGASGGGVGTLLGTLKAHRRCEKLISTYLNGEKITSPVDGRFHSHYKTFGTQTGRLSSSSDPWSHGGNAQNLDRDLKWLFLPDE